MHKPFCCYESVKHSMNSLFIPDSAGVLYIKHRGNAFISKPGDKPGTPFIHGKKSQHSQTEL